MVVGDERRGYADPAVFAQQSPNYSVCIASRNPG